MHRLDDLDVRIVRELGSPSSPQWNVRETYSSIAKRIGIDEETVRRRVKRAERLGSITGWKMMVNPRLIECKAAALDLEVAEESEKDKAVSKLKKVDGVIKILNFRGKGLQLNMYYPNEQELERKLELISSICGSSKLTSWELFFPRPNVRMTKTDWRISEAMLDDARESLEDVSKNIGVSARTIERHLTAICDGRGVYLQGTPVFKNFVGLGCLFLVYCPDSEKKRTVDDVISKTHRIEITGTNAEQYSTFATAFDNLAQADEFVTWIEGLDGVKKVKMGIMKDLIVVQDWLHEELLRRAGML